MRMTKIVDLKHKIADNILKIKLSIYESIKLNNELEELVRKVDDERGYISSYKDNVELFIYSTEKALKSRLNAAISRYKTIDEIYNSNIKLDNQVRSDIAKYNKACLEKHIEPAQLGKWLTDTTSDMTSIYTDATNNYVKFVQLHKSAMLLCESRLHENEDNIEESAKKIGVNNLYNEIESETGTTDSADFE